MIENFEWLPFVAFYCIFCNTPYWIAAHEFGFSPLGWFCVEYPALGLVAQFAPRLVTLVLLLVLTKADVICGTYMTFYIPVRECLENIRVAIESSAAHPFRALSVLLLVFLIAAVATDRILSSLGKQNGNPGFSLSAVMPFAGRRLLRSKSRGCLNLIPLCE